MATDVDSVIENMIVLFGLTERNILQSLTEQQCKVWVQWAVLGRPEKEIAKEFFGHCKSASAGAVRQVIRAAQVKIIAELLSDISNIKDFLTDRPGLSSKVKELINHR